MTAGVLVTGASGLVGQAVCEYFCGQGTKFVSLSRHHIPDYPESKIFDLSSQFELAEVISGPVSAIIHLAAAVPMAACYPDTEESAALTRKMDQTVLQAARCWGCRVIYVSTCGLYDREVEGSIITEESALPDFSSPYLMAKFDGEELFKANTAATILRISAPLGPGQRKSSIVSRFISQARGNTNIELWGSGSREQNFIDVSDIACLIGLVLKDPVNTVLNVASSLPISMEGLARMIVRLVGKGTVVFSENKDPNEGEKASFSIARAQELYGWSPSISLEDTLRNLLNEEFIE